mgnify:CR=1 FL=1
MKNKFDSLTIPQQAELMKIFIKSGIKDLDKMKNIYNTYSEGGLLDKPKSYEKPLPQVRYANGGYAGSRNGISAEEALRLSIEARKHGRYYGTHKLGYVEQDGRGIVFPSIQSVDYGNPDSPLKDYSKEPFGGYERALQHGDTFSFKTPRQADYYTRHYKEVPFTGALLGDNGLFGRYYAGGGPIDDDKKDGTSKKEEITPPFVMPVLPVSPYGSYNYMDYARLEKQKTLLKTPELLLAEKNIQQAVDNTNVYHAPIMSPKDKDKALRQSKESRMKRAIYNSVYPSPFEGVPNFFDAAMMYINAKSKMLKGKEDEVDYDTPDNLAAKNNDAMWAKYMGQPYDEKYLPVWNGDTVRLPYELEKEIPVDTNLLKKRINEIDDILADVEYGTDAFTILHPVARAEKIEEYRGRLEKLRKADVSALKSLRRTYKTGQTVGIGNKRNYDMDFGVYSWNSRPIYKENTLEPIDIFTTYPSPVAGLGRYNIRYSPKDNKMYYSDQYDFGFPFDNVLGGRPYRVRGAISLQKPEKDK